jgi:hypothetical protein
MGPLASINAPVIYRRATCACVLHVSKFLKLIRRSCVAADAPHLAPVARHVLPSYGVALPSSKAGSAAPSKTTTIHRRYAEKHGRTAAELLRSFDQTRHWQSDNNVM